MKITLEKFMIIYLIIGLFFFHMANVPELYKSLISLPSFFVLPYLVGWASLNVSVKGKVFIVNSCIIERTILLWIIGTIFLILFVYTLGFLDLWMIAKYAYLIVISYIIFISFLIKDIIWTQFDTSWELAKYNPKLLLFLVFPGLTNVLITKLYLPFPLIGYNFMIPTVIYQPVVRLIEDGFVGGGQTIPVILTALSSMIFDIEPLSFIWSAPFLLVLIFSIGLFIFVKGVTNNMLVSFLAVFIGVFIFSGSNICFDSFCYNYRSNTILYALFPFMLYMFRKNIQRIEGPIKTRDIFILFFTITFFSTLLFVLSNLSSILGIPLIVNVYIVVFGSILILLIGYVLGITLFSNNSLRRFYTVFLIVICFCYLSHFQEGLLFSFSLVIYSGLLIFSHHEKFISMSFAILVIAMMYVLLQILGILNIETNNFLSSLLYGNTYEIWLSFSKKFLVFRYSVGHVVILSAIICGFLAVYLKNRELLAIVSVLGILVIIFFLPDDFTYRFYKEICPFLSIVSAYGIVYLLKFFEGRTKWKIKTVYITLIIVLLLPTFVDSSYERFSKLPEGMETASAIADFEYQAADWLRENTTKNTIILSDFRTMVLVTPLANRISPVEKTMLVSELGEEDLTTLGNIKDILSGTNSDLVYDAIKSVYGKMSYRDKYYLESQERFEDISYVIIVSSRTIKWLKTPSLNPVKNPQVDDVPSVYIDKLLSFKNFKLIYSIDEKIYIFKMEV